MDPRLNSVFQWIIKETAGSGPRPEPSSFKPMSEKDKAWLMEAIESMTVDEAEELKKAVAALDDHSASTEAILSALEGIQAICDNLDLANVLAKIGGMERLVSLLAHDDVRVRVLAAETLAVTVQNDAPTQDAAAALGALGAATEMLADVLAAGAEGHEAAASASAAAAAAPAEAETPPPGTELFKALLAVSSLVRGHEAMTAAFVTGAYSGLEAPPPMLLGDAPAPGDEAPSAAVDGLEASAAEPGSSSRATARPRAPHRTRAGLPAGPTLLAAVLGTPTFGSKCRVRALFLLRYLLESQHRMEAASSVHYAALTSGEGHGLVRLCTSLLTAEEALAGEAPPYALLRTLEAASRACKVAFEARLVVQHAQLSGSAAVPFASVQVDADVEGLSGLHDAVTTLISTLKAMPRAQREDFADEEAAAQDLAKWCGKLLA